MHSFAKPALSIHCFKGTYAALEGDKEAIAILIKLFKALGAITYTIDKEKKALYHAGAVFASNYLVILAETALSCMLKAGISEEIALPSINHIMQGTMNNLKETRTPKKALSGPIKRKDIVTIKTHMQAFSDTQTKALYAELGKASLALTSHSQKDKKEIEKALEPPSSSASAYHIPEAGGG